MKGNDLVAEDVVAGLELGGDLDGRGEVVGGDELVGGPDASRETLGFELGEGEGGGCL